ncbi:hypothetical protein H5410_053624 [Solanum commersonii]|uniref:SAUR family protein n=1 Tax=Solanum commersonii TaxID=4109 RepID=A0A9J5X6E3_SOLCO|nr:hypothetical protein H5410_053624 [Solanum commersonii]
MTFVIKAVYILVAADNGGAFNQGHQDSFSPRYDDDKNRVDFKETSIEDEEVVPYDVKEGHFAIFAVNAKEERKRFILELNWLKNLTFLSLLKLAEEEYGFRQKGVLEIPCSHEELDKLILQLKIERI